MKIAVEGCCHGELDKIYEVIGQLWERDQIKVDLLICCGDFQAVRNSIDLHCMAVPPKYREIGSFHKYYSGEKKAPVLTVFIGGNHEASNHLWELSYGGWVAPNIYYLGTAGVVRFGGLRIAGLSGIFKGGDYRKGRHECPPFTEGTMRSIYHIRSCDVFRLKQLSGHVDIGLSHDWPLGIYHHGNKKKLIQKKGYFAQEISQNTLGSPPAMELLQHLRPSYWFSAHLHVKFAAIYHHHEPKTMTKFLALDKCLPSRKYLQLLDMPAPSPPPFQLEYDPQWLAILRSTEHLMQYSPSLWLPPHPQTDDRHSFTPTGEEMEEVEQLFRGDFTVPSNFTVTVPPHPSTPHQAQTAQPLENPQTTELCRKLNLPNPFTPNFKSHTISLSWKNELDSSNPDEIQLSDKEEEEEEKKQSSVHVAPQTSATPQQKRYPWLDRTSSEEEEKEEGGGGVGTLVGGSAQLGPLEGGGRGALVFRGSHNPDEIDLEESEDEAEGEGRGEEEEGEGGRREGGSRKSEVKQEGKEESRVSKEKAEVRKSPGAVPECENEYQTGSEEGRVRRRLLVLPQPQGSTASSSETETQPSSKTREEEVCSQLPSLDQRGSLQSGSEVGPLPVRTEGTSAVSMDTGSGPVSAVSACGEGLAVMASGDGGGVLIAVGIEPREEEEEEEEKVGGQREGGKGEVVRGREKEEPESKEKRKIRRRNFDLYRSQDEEEDS